MKVFDMKDSNTCVCGQVFREEITSGYLYFIKKYSKKFAIQLGFESPDIESPGIFVSSLYYDLLKAEWVKQIRKTK